VPEKLNLAEASSQRVHMNNPLCWLLLTQVLRCEKLNDTSTGRLRLSFSAGSGLISNEKKINNFFLSLFQPTFLVWKK
jgi:hypothetical protein